MVGKEPVIWTAKLGHLITSMLLTRVSTRICSLGLLSMLMALALPRRMMVALAHFVMRMDWLISTSISIGAEGESKFSTSHLLPSSSFFGCFFDSDYVTGSGTSHGTPYLYDRAVPVLARAPGRIAAGQVIDAPRPSLVYAATIAALLGLEPDETWRDVAPLVSP